MGKGGTSIRVKQCTPGPTNSTNLGFLAILLRRNNERVQEMKIGVDY